MIDQKKVLALIPARGGSKGVLRKNVRLLDGKPLIGWSIEEAKKSKYIDRIILSSEDDEIINIAKSLGCGVPFIRPAHLATDTASGMDAVLHALSQIPDYYYVVLLQPTSPLRSAADIDACLELCHTRNANFCVSVTASSKNPEWMFYFNHLEQLSPIIAADNRKTRRQDLKKAFVLNGAVYVAKIQSLIKTKTFLNDETLGYEMPAERSLDIDSELDLLFADFLLKQRKPNQSR